METYNNGVLQGVMPGAAKVNRYVNVDSRDRHKPSYPDTNDYVLALKEPLFGVTRVELVSAEMPKTEYFVDDSNNLLEILIDPVLFASTVPSASTERLIAVQHNDGCVLVVRVDDATRPGHGVLQDVCITEHVPGTTSVNTRLAIGGEHVFNASATSFIDCIVIFASAVENVYVIAYSEREDNHAGCCRMAIVRKEGPLGVKRVSFGSEFGFEYLPGSTSQLPVFHKRLCALHEGRFAMAYCFADTSVRIRVGSCGIRLDDTESRESNSNLVSSLTGRVGHYSACRVTDTLSLAVFVEDGSRLVCQLTEMDESFAIHSRHRLELPALATTTTSQSVGEAVTIPQPPLGVHAIEGVSVDCMNKRALVAITTTEGRLHVYVLLVVEGPGLLLLNGTIYDEASAAPSINASSALSFRVDPHVHVRWSSDVYQVVTFMARRVDAGGDGIVLTVDGLPDLFPTVVLQDHEYYRLQVVAHPHDEHIPEEILSQMRVYTTSTQDAGYTRVLGIGSSSLVIGLDGSVSTLFYGMAGRIERGVLSVNPSTGPRDLAFSVFTSGAHDVGNMPYTYVSSHESSVHRSLRLGFQTPGDAHGAAVVGVGDGSIGFMTIGGDVWCHSDGAGGVDGAGGWSFLGQGDAADAHHGTQNQRPGARVGQMLASSNNRVYLFGGSVVSAPSAYDATEPMLSVRHTSDSDQDGAVLVMDLRNGTSLRLLFYDLTVGTGASGRMTFCSTTDPALAGGGLHRWINLQDVSHFFDRPTLGLMLNSFSQASARFVNRLVDGGAGYASDWGTGPNPTRNARYTMQVLLYAHVSSTDLTGQLAALGIGHGGGARGTLLDVVAYVYDAGVQKETHRITVVVQEWTNFTIAIDPAQWSSQTLEEMTVEFVVNPLFMQAGFLAFRDPELLLDELRLPSVENETDPSSTLTFRVFDDGLSSGASSATAYSTGAATPARVTAIGPVVYSRTFPLQFRSEHRAGSTSGSADGSGLMNDLWTFAIDATFVHLDFCLTGRTDDWTGLSTGWYENAAAPAVSCVRDRCLKVIPDQNAAGLVQQSSFTRAVQPVAGRGEQLYDIGASVLFEGLSALSVRGSGSAIRAVRAGDFSLSATVLADICKPIVVLDHRTSTLHAGIGEPPVQQSPIGLQQSTSIPHVYASGTSLVVRPGASVLYACRIPDLVSLASFVFAPPASSASHAHVLFTLADFEVRLRGSRMLVSGLGLDIAIVQSEWFHLAINLNGMAAQVFVNGALVGERLVERTGTHGFGMHGPDGARNVLVAGVCVFTAFRATGLGTLQRLSLCHMRGYIPSGRHVLFGCGQQGAELRVEIRATEAVPRIVATFLTSSLSVDIEPGPLRVTFGREAGVLRLRAGPHVASTENRLSTGLLSTEVFVGSARTFGSFFVDGFIGSMDEIRLLRHAYELHADEPAGAHPVRERLMVWRRIELLTPPATGPEAVGMLVPRMHGSMTSDEAGNLWVFGGVCATGTAGDLWQLKPNGVRATDGVLTYAAYHVNGSPLGGGAVLGTAAEPGDGDEQALLLGDLAGPEQHHPGGLSHCAVHNDGRSIYVFGGQTLPPVGPFQVSCVVTKAYTYTPLSDAETSVIFEGSRSGLFYPVFTAREAVLFDAQHAVVLEVLLVGEAHVLYAFPEPQQHQVGLDAFIRTSAPADPLLVLDPQEHLNSSVRPSAQSRFWKYDINTADWELLHTGSGARTSSSPGPRSACTIHPLQLASAPAVPDDITTGVVTRGDVRLYHDSRVFVLFQGGGGAGVPGDGGSVYAGQDVWTFSTSSRAWKLVRTIADDTRRVFGTGYGTSVAPGLSATASASAHWAAAGGRSVRVLVHGVTFTNQLLGTHPEVNLHYGIAISGHVRYSDTERVAVAFLHRDTFERSSIYPGVLHVCRAPDMGDGAFFVLTQSRLMHIRVPPAADVTGQDADVVLLRAIALYDPMQQPAGSAREVVTVLPPVGEYTLVAGIQYVFDTGELDASDFSVPVTPTATGGLIVLASDDFAVTGTSADDGTGNGAVRTFRVVPFETAARAAAGDTGQLQTASSVLRAPVAVASSLLSQLLPDVVHSHMSAAVVLSEPARAVIRLVYQDHVNNRYGTACDVAYEASVGTFVASGRPLVFSSHNPTSALALSPALFGRAVVVGTLASGSFSGLVGSSASTEDGQEAVLKEEHTASALTMISEIRGSQFQVCLLNDLQFSPQKALWLVYFVYNAKLRVLAQRSVGDELDAPVQNLVGEVIRFSDGLVLREGISPVAVRLCRFETGDMANEAVVVYIAVAPVENGGADGTGTAGTALQGEASVNRLYFEDVLVSHCDPVADTSVRPEVGTTTFSLIEEIGLVSSDSSALGDVEVVSLRSVSRSNFTVFFLSASRLGLCARFYVRDRGSYVTGRVQELVTYARPVSLQRACVSPIERQEQESQRGQFVLTVQMNDSVEFVFVSLASEETHSLRVTDRVVQMFDNPNPVVVADSLITPSSVTVFSVHEDENTQACPVTLRSVRLADEGRTVLLERESFLARVTPGDYVDAQSFASELKARLLTVDANFSVGFDAGTTKLSIRNAFSPFRILLNADFHGKIRDASASNGMAYILGFRDFKDAVSRVDGVSHLITSPNRVDLSGRQYLYLFLSSPHGSISSEVTSRNKQNAFGRIILAVEKGRTMFFTNSLYVLEAEVNIPVLTQIHVRLGRFPQINSSLADGRDIFLYNPQGVEHSLSLKVTCSLDKIGSGRGQHGVVTLPPQLAWNASGAETAGVGGDGDEREPSSSRDGDDESDDDYLFYG